jgi:hypothetical protein
MRMIYEGSKVIDPPLEQSIRPLTEKKERLITDSIATVSSAEEAAPIE